MFDSDAQQVPGGATALALERTDPAGLGDGDLVRYVQAAERQVAYANAVALRAVLLLADRAEAAALAKSTSTRGPRLARDRAGRLVDAEMLAARTGIDEVRQALRLSRVAADNRVALARALHTGPSTAVGEALRSGHVTLAHARVAMEHLAGRPADLATDMLARALPRAARQTPGDFGKSLTRAEHALDPVGSAERYREAVATKTGLFHRADGDGTGTLSLTAAEPETEWAFSVIDTLARAELRNRRQAAGPGVDNNGVPATPAEPRADNRDNSASAVATGASTGVPTGASVAVDNNGVPTTPSNPGTDDRSPVSVAARPAVDKYGVLGTPPVPQGINGEEATGIASEAASGADETASGAGETARGRNGVPTAPYPSDAENRSRVSTGAPVAVDKYGVLGTPHEPRPAAPRPSLPALRAEVLLGLLHRAVSDPSFPTSHGKRRVDTQVVLTLDTLLGLRDDPACINGRPVPGPIAREMASGSSTLRRLVTDPVAGHLLDYGDAFPVPAPLAEFVLARDGECRVPHCHVKATVADMEHAIPRGQGGSSSSQNIGPMCRSDHTSKTAGHTDVVDSSADGSAMYVTVLGQRIAIPPRPVLEPPALDADATLDGSSETDVAETDPPF